MATSGQLAIGSLASRKQMRFTVTPVADELILPLRNQRRARIPGQIVHDLIHQRPGWTRSHALELDGKPVGFGTIAIAGPWTGRPTVFEFELEPPVQTRTFEAFEEYLAASGARHFEVQTSDTLLTIMLHAYGRNVVSEKIVFADLSKTTLPSQGATIRPLTPLESIQESIRQRRGGGEWALEREGRMLGKGGLLFHYSPPFGDLYMDIDEGFRRQGHGAYLVQELKRICRELGAVPTARCNVGNIASRQTLQRAGFAPASHILLGDVA